jgi:hypothetical protein
MRDFASLTIASNSSEWIIYAQFTPDLEEWLACTSSAPYTNLIVYIKFSFYEV